MLDALLSFEGVSFKIADSLTRLDAEATARDVEADAPDAETEGEKVYK